MSRIKKPTIGIVIRKGKQLSKGEYPIFLRLTFNRESKFYALKGEQSGLSTELDKWNAELGRFKRNKELNRYLDAYELRANEVLREIDSEVFSFQAFESKYFKKYDHDSVFSFMEIIISNLQDENRLGTASCYKDTKNRLKEFRHKILFSHIDEQFLHGFEKYLISKGNSTNSISIYLRTLRAVYNRAITENLIQYDNYPFKKFKIKNGNSTKRALTKQQIRLIIGFESEPQSRKWHSHNLFTFSYLTRGMNMTDMAMLKWKENINDNRIIYVRAKTTNTKKTNEPIIIKIEPEIQKILDRYPRTNDYIFPILQPDLSELTKRYRIKSALKKISKDITDMAKSLNIESADKITHYWARHTYATALKRSGIPIAVISEALGHSSESTTKAYLDKFEQTEIDNTFQYLL